MTFDEAQQRLASAGWFPGEPGLSVVEQLDMLKQLAAEGTLPPEGAAIWYALAQHLRYLADYYERDLIRHLRYRDGLKWVQVADAVQAQLGSRQAAHAKWRRLLDPARQTTTGNMRSGGRRRGSSKSASA